MDEGLQVLILVLCGALAGVINSVAGGGMLISFPALIFFGLQSITANATSTVAMFMGTSATLWAYRRELTTQKRWALRFSPPSLLGGLAGAFLLLHTGEALFRTFVPFLILFAALLFTFQGTVVRWLEIEAHLIEQSHYGIGAAIFVQFCIAIYGGYFGAGIGILMLAALGVLGHTDIHEMNSLKALLGLLINGIAAFYFIVSGSVRWKEAAILTAGAVVGGSVGPPLARKAGSRVVRVFVSAVGFFLGFYFLLR